MKNEDYPRTKKDAIAAGLKHFFTNKRCLNDHLDLRTIHSGQCVLCRREYFRRHAIEQRKNPAFRKYQREYQAKYKLTERGKQNISKAHAKHKRKLEALRDEVRKTDSS